MTRFFYCESCPLQEECTPQNFKTWGCWGYTEEECRAKVLKHLRGSGKHKECVPKGESRDELYVEMCEPEALALIEDYYEPPAEPKKKTKARSDDGDGTGAVGQKSKAGPPSPPLSLATSSMDGVDGSSPAALKDMPLAKKFKGNPISRAELQEFSDSLQTCINSAKHAQRLSAMASKVLCGVLQQLPTHIPAPSPLRAPADMPPGGALMGRCLGMRCSWAPSCFPTGFRRRSQCVRGREDAHRLEDGVVPEMSAQHRLPPSWF